MNGSAAFDNLFGEMGYWCLNYHKFYEELGVRKWERVISEENIDDEECKER